MNGKKEEDAPPPTRGKNNKPKTLGPVINLEEHVSPNWWHKIFNSIYLKTDGDVVEDSKITQKEIDLFSGILNLSKEDKILDLCCGQGRHCLELAKRGFKNINGLDRSRYLIKKAREKARKENLIIKFKEGDARKLPYHPDEFDVIMILGNSFGYFESIKDDIQVLKEVFRALKPEGKLIVDIADGDYLKDNFKERSWEWVDKKHFVCRERSLSSDKEKIISREVVNNVDKGVIVDQFYAERIYTKENLSKILSEAGFNETNFQDSFSPDSQRNEDLGMMEKRNIVISIAKKEWTPVKKRIEIIKNIAVIMGDPNKPDKLKPSSIFDEDDFYTINQLKGALKEIEKEGCNFIYLNNHNTLIKDLIKIKDKISFVLNLCDEGYNNDPRKELHIPALLEKLGIHYTGAGPQCLAYCYDKSLVRGIAREMNISIPNAVYINPDDTIFKLPINFPIIVKPNFGDSSFGITKESVAENHEEFLNAIAEIRGKFGYEKPILVEEFLKGKDLSVGIIGNPPSSYFILPLTEEDYSAVPDNLPKICGYEAKWVEDSPYWNIKSVPAQISEETKIYIIDSCLKLFERLECRDYARFDWRLDEEGKPKLLEVNPNPGWCWDGHLAKMAKYADISYSEMLKAILKVAESRITNNTPNKTQPNEIAITEVINKKQEIEK